MTIALAGEDIARRVAEAVPGVVEESDSNDVWVKPESIREVCRFLKDDPNLQFDYLVAVSAVDYIDHFAMVLSLGVHCQEPQNGAQVPMLGQGEPDGTLRSGGMGGRELSGAGSVRPDGNPL